MNQETERQMQKPVATLPPHRGLPPTSLLNATNPEAGAAAPFPGQAALAALGSFDFLMDPICPPACDSCFV